MITTRPDTATHRLMATASLVAMAFALVAAPAVGAAGLRNCVDVTGPRSGRAGCYEDVWANGTEYRMTFSNTRFTGSTPKPLDPFYVVAAQTDQPQGAPPNTFAHDHVVRAIPSQNHGTYSVRLQGFFVLCSGQGVVSGACVPQWTSLGGDPLPFAQTVNGHALTSTTVIEAAADAGDLALVDLGPGAVIVGSISGRP